MCTLIAFTNLQQPQKGPEDLEPKCLASKKNRSQGHTINKNTEIKLARIYRAFKPDLDDLVGPYQFADWTYDEYRR